MTKKTASSPMQRKGSAQALCDELFLAVEGALSDAWISDDASTDDPVEYLRFVRGSLYALQDAGKIMRKFLRKHERRTHRQEGK